MAHVYKLFSAYKLENIFYAFALHLGQKKTFGLISSLPELSAAEVQLKIHSPSFPAHLPKSFSWVLPSFQRQKEKGNHRFIFCGLFPTFLEFLYQPPRRPPDRPKPFCWALLQDDGGGAGSVTKEIKSGSFVSSISPPPLQYSR